MARDVPVPAAGGLAAAPALAPEGVSQPTPAAVNRTPPFDLPNRLWPDRPLGGVLRRWDSPHMISTASQSHTAPAAAGHLYVRPTVRPVPRPVALEPATW